MASAPILILGNKIDRPGAASEEDLKTYFNLHGQTTGKVYLYTLLQCVILCACVYTGVHFRHLYFVYACHLKILMIPDLYACIVYSDCAVDKSY